MVAVPTHFFKVIGYQQANSPKLSVEVGPVICANNAHHHLSTFEAVLKVTQLCMGVSFDVVGSINIVST